jgi:uncharacterized protein YdcH (DUF465 family)
MKVTASFTTDNRRTAGSAGRIELNHETSRSIRDLIDSSPTREWRKASMDKAHVEALVQKHAAIDAQLQAESHRRTPDMTLVTRLKKEKLRLKDDMVSYIH